MRRRSCSWLAPLLLTGVLGAGCGQEDQSLNGPPALTGPTVEASEILSGATVPLTLEAADLDENTLTYTWTQAPASPAGSFSSTSAARPRWTAPQVTEATSFQLGVTVTNSRSRMTQASVTVRVLPLGNQAPVLLAISDPSVVTGSSLVQLSVSAMDGTAIRSPTPGRTSANLPQAPSAMPRWPTPSGQRPR
jgi:hypothetical protein